MKTKWTKNKTIGLLSILVMTLTSYIVKDKIRFGFPTAKAAVPKRKGIVETPVSYFKNASELEVCYKDLLSREPEVDEGTVTLNLSFNNTGKVDSLDLVRSDIDDKDFHNCLIQQIKKKTYPVTADRVGVLIIQKINFHKRMASTLNFDTE